MSDINWKDKCWVTTVFLVRDDGRVLLNMNKNLQKWIPVGGHIDVGETPVEAIKREVQEETGFSFDFVPKPLLQSGGRVTRIFPIVVQMEQVPHHNVHMNLVFAGRVTDWHEKDATDEDEKLRWFTEEELRSEDLLEQVRDGALEALRVVRNSAQ